MSTWKNLIKSLCTIVCLTALLILPNMYGPESVQAATSTPKNMMSFVNVVDERVREALLTEKQDVIKIDLSDLEFPYKKNLSKSYQLHYLLPYFNNTVKLDQIQTIDGYYDNLIIKKSISTDKIKKHIHNIDAKINPIMDEANKAKTRAQKLLVFHDYIVQNTHYDMGYYKDDISLPSYSTFGVLIKNKAVCNGYSNCFQYLCLKAGIDCRIVSSSVDEHCWNIVRLGKNYYHVDVTWDDPVPDITGRVNHEHFLLTDEQIRGDGHTKWNSQGIKCKNKYTSRYWKNIKSQIAFTSTHAYFIKNNSLVKRNIKTGKEKKIVKNLGVWKIAGSNSYYSSAYSTLFLHNNKIYFNTAKAVKRYSLKTNRVSTVFKINSANSIYGITKKGNKIKYVLKKDFNDEGTVKIHPKKLS